MGVMIPAGYQIHVKSYEGDGDSFRTITKSGFTFADTKFLVDFLTALKPIGNQTNSVESYIDILTDLAKMYSNVITPELNKTLEVGLDADGVASLLYELLGPVEEGYEEEGGIFCRCVDMIDVYFINHPISSVFWKFENYKAEK